jgi:ABC-type nitrate/sulfonate/bicarbonate transport system substrate-binding protein
MNETASSAACRRPAALACGSSARKRVRRLPAVLACAAVAIVVTACSSGGGGQAAAGGGGQAAAGGSSGGGTTSVTIGKAVDTIGFTAVDVAKAKGYFAQEGIKVTEDLLDGSSTAFAALQSGSVNFVTASSTALLSAKAKGVPLEAVASMDYGVSLQLLVADKWMKSHDLSPGQPLNTVMKKMVGAKLGVISTTDLTYDHYLEQQAGVDPNKLTYIHIGSQSAALAGLKYGEIDAFLLSPPSGYFAQSQGGATVVATLHQVPELANMAYDILVVDSDWAKSHASEVSAVATAIAMADNAMKNSPQSVLGTEKQHYPQMSDSVLLESLKYVTFAPDGLFTGQMWQDALSEYKGTEGDNAPSGVNVSENGGTWTNQYIKKSALSGGSASLGSTPSGTRRSPEEESKDSAAESLIGAGR